MELSYGLRLTCVVLVSAAIAQVFAAVLIQQTALRVLRLLEDRSAAMQERALFWMQMLPLLFGVVSAGTFCAPAYLHSETNYGPEPVSLLCLLFAAVAIAWYGSGLLRGLALIARTETIRQNCRRSGRVHAGKLANPGMISMQSGHPQMALVAAFRPFILVSEGVLREMSPAALGVALDHERAHARRRDNWKLLMLLSLPTLPLVASGKIRSEWRRRTEWAADDLATSGSVERALLLAESLIAFARAAGNSARTELAGTLTVRFASDESDLPLRIHRLTDRYFESPSGVAGDGVDTQGNKIPALLLMGTIALMAASLETVATRHLYPAVEYLLHL